MRDERNVYGKFKFFLKYRLGQQFRWRVFWFNLSGKLFAGYWHSKRSQIGPNIVDICSELWGKVSLFRIGYSFAAIFFGKFPMIEFYAWLYCMLIHLVTNIEKRFMGNKTGCAEKSFGLISWQVSWWLQKLAKHRGTHFIHFIKPDTFVKSEKHLKPIHRDQKLDPDISHSTWEETNLFK